MKKNAMLKIAAVLLVAVLLTTCAISSTFAKYATEKTTLADAARVAKWGVTLKAKDGTDATSLFKDEYETSDGSVKTSATTDLMAPGTSGSSTFAFTAEGIPEVSGEIQYTVKVTVTGFTTYCPIKFKVNNEDVTATNGEGLAQALTAKLNGIFAKETFTPETKLTENDKFNKSATIEWAWAFDGANGANDAKDTALGDAADNNKISIEITAQIVQTGPAVAEN